MVANPKGVIAYLLLAFGIAWVSWEFAVRVMHIDVTSSQFQLYALPGAFAPAIAALVVRAFSKGGWSDAKFRLPISKWPYFLFALLLPVAVITVVAVEAQALGYLPASFDLAKAMHGAALAPTDGPGQASIGAAMAKIGPWLIPIQLATAIPMSLVLWGEEFGWRGYLQPRLFPGKPVIAAIVTGVIWAAWHYPLILRGYDFGHEQAVLGCAVMVVGTILLSYIFGWLVERTGSIWSSSLAHSATNVVGGSLSVLWFGSHDLAMTSYLGVLAWPPLLVVCVLIFLFGRRKAAAQPVEQPS
ncbi:MAG TPA: type II CAAX endopeptidase family protein [Caulobacteraceae bacterium]|jgi:membrane protease YdiL (CAAX protease family)